MPAQMSIALPESKKQLSTQSEQELALRALAMELVKDLDDADKVIRRYGLDLREYEELAKSRQFRAMLAEAGKEWDKASNTKERVRLKSAYIIEQSLERMYSELTNDAHPLSSRADLFGRIARIAELGNPAPATVANAEAFSITINLGAEKPITIHQQLPPQVTLSDVEYEDL